MSFYSDFAEHYEEVFPFRGETYAFLKRHLPIGARRVLDVGCGTGHYCGKLAEEGFEATGIDLDPEMIVQARRTYPAAVFLTMDMTAIGELGGSFDAAFCIGNVFSHLGPGQRSRFLSVLTVVLRPGGTWIVQTVNWDRILEAGETSFPERRLPSSGLVFRREYRDVTTDRVRFLTRLASERGMVFEGETILYPLAATTRDALHHEHGLHPEARFGDFREAPFDADASPASIAVYRRV